MKKITLLLVFFIASTLFAQQTYVPDDNFENDLETHNVNRTTVLIGDTTSM